MIEIDLNHYCGPDMPDLTSTILLDDWKDAATLAARELESLNQMQADLIKALDEADRLKRGITYTQRNLLTLGRATQTLLRLDDSALAGA